MTLVEIIIVSIFTSLVFGTILFFLAWDLALEIHFDREFRKLEREEKQKAEERNRSTK